VYLPKDCDDLDPMGAFLFINQYYWPDEAATAQLLADLAEDLAKAGHQVTILCGRSRYLCSQPLSAGALKQRGVTIERVSGTDFGRFRWMGRGMDILTFLFFAFLRLCRMPRHDVVIAMTSPPFLGRLAMYFQRKHQSRLVLWSQDIYPEIAEKVGALKNYWLLRVLRKNAQKMYKVSSKVIVPGDDMKRFLSRIDVLDGKVVCIPNWSDVGQHSKNNAQMNLFRDRHGWGNIYVLMYSGNLGVANDTESMLSLLLLFQKNLDSFLFVLVGSSQRHEDFANRAREAGLIKILCLPAQPRSDLSELLESADAHLISQRMELDGLLVPSKFYGAVCPGRPVIFIGPPQSEIGRITREENLGAVLVPDKIKEDFAKARSALISIRNDWSVSPRIRAWAQTNASRKVRTDEFEKVLNELVAT